MGRLVVLVDVRRRLARWIAVTVLVAVPAPAWPQDPAGGEFQVNSYTGGATRPSVASDASGNFVVAWTRYAPGYLNSEIMARGFNASGVPQDVEFQVNVYTTGTQRFPSMVSDATGNFVVVWVSDGEDGSSTGIFGRRFDSSGVPQGNVFQANSYTTGAQTTPSVALDESGNFVVVWHSDGQDGSGFGVFGRRFDATGTAQGTEFQVNTYTSDAQAFPAVATDASGNFVVVWHSYAPRGIFARRYDALGAAQGSEFEVRSHLTGSTAFPDVAMDANGNFIVVWSKTSGEPSGGPGVFGRRLDSAGNFDGLQFQVNSYTNVGWFPEVAADASGNFVAVWHGYGQDGSNWGSFGQRFDASGVRQGTEFRVNAYTTNAQSNPSVATNHDGDFVVAWQSRQYATYRIFAQRYGDLIFQDDFESSDLTRWSSASTDGFDLDAAGGGAALGGTGIGLQAFIDDANPLYVQDATPVAENRYRARFYFDPNGFDPGEAGNYRRVRIFIAFNAASERLATLVLRRLVGQYSIMGRVRRDDGSRADTGFFPISDAPHFVEFDWQRSSAPGASDGQFVLRIDDAVVSTLLGLDNDSSPVEHARMGVMSIKTAAASGTVYLDQFESRRQRYIGPE